jgi:hypothetical protein
MHGTTRRVIFSGKKTAREAEPVEASGGVVAGRCWWTSGTKEQRGTGVSRPCFTSVLHLVVCADSSLLPRPHGTTIL